MKEIEVKILNIDVSAVRKKLSSLNAKKTFEGMMKTLVFDFSDERFKKNDELLRLRYEGDGVKLCYKGAVKASRFKVREEKEIFVSDLERTRELLQSLGLKVVLEYEKHREEYALDNAKCVLDTYTSIPTYLEIEGNTEKIVEQLVLRLGFTMAQTTNVSASEVLKAAGKSTYY